MKRLKKTPQNLSLEKVRISVTYRASRVCCVVFDSADALLTSEVKMLLEHRKAQYETQEEDHELSEVGTLAY